MAYTNPNATAAYNQTTPLAGTSENPVVVANTDTYGADVYAQTLNVASTTTVTGATVISGGAIRLMNDSTTTTGAHAAAYAVSVGNGGVLSADTNNKVVSGGALVSGAIVEAGGRLVTYNQTTASNCTIKAGATWQRSNDNVLAGHATVIEQGVSHDAFLGADFWVDNGVIKNMNLTNVTYARLLIRDIDVSGGVINTGCTLQMESGVMLRDITVNTGGKLAWNATGIGMAGDATNVSKGAIARFGANAEVVNGVASNFAIGNNYAFTFTDGITLKDATVTNGTVNITDGGKMTGGSVTAGAVNIMSAGIYNTTVTTTNSMLTLQANAYVENVTANRIFWNGASITIAGADTNIDKIYHWSTAGYRFGADAKIVNGVATGFTIGYQGDNIYNFGSGITLKDATVKARAHFLDGAVMEGGTITAGNPVNFSSGAVMRDVTVTGGTVTILNGAEMRGGTVSNVTVAVQSKAVVSGTVLSNGGRINLGAAADGGAKAYDMIVSNGGILSAATNNSATEANVVISGATVLDGGSLLGGNRVVFEDCDIKSGATMTMTNMTRLTGRKTNIAADAVTSARLGENFHVENGVIHDMELVKVADGTYQLAISDMDVVNGTIGTGGNLYMTGVGNITLENITVTDTGVINWATNNNTLKGAATNIRKGAVTRFGNNAEVVNGVASNFAFTNNWVFNLGEGITLKNAAINAGTINFKGAVIGGGNQTNVKTGATVNDAVIQGEGAGMSMDGGTVNNVSLVGDAEAEASVNNARLIMYGGTVNGGSVRDNAFFSFSAGTANDLTVGDLGRLNFSHGVTVNRVTLHSGGAVNVRGGVLNGIGQQGGALNVDQLVVSGAVVGRGVVNDARATGGTVNVASGGELVNAQISGDAIVKVVKDGNGATIAGAATNIAEGALYFGNTSLKGEVKNGVLTGLTAEAAYQLSIGDGILAKDVELNNGAIRISAFNGASVDGATVKAGAIICNAGAAGTMDNVTIMGTGIMNLSGTAQATGTVVEEGGQFALNAATVKAENTVIRAGGKFKINAAGADTGANLTLDFTGAGAGAKTFVNDLALVSDTTTVYVKGAEQAAGTYTLGDAGTLGTVTRKWGLYENAIAANGSYDDALNGLTYAFDGTAVTTAALSITTGAAAGLAGDNYTALRTADRAAKWTGATDNATLVTESFAGDAFLTVAGDAAKAIYGAGVDYEGTVNINAKSGTIRNLAAGAEAGKTVGAVKLTFDGATLGGTGYAGGFGSVTGATETLVAYGTFQKDFYAGALANKNAEATGVGNVNLTVEGGTFAGNLYGASAVKTAATVGDGIRHTAGDVTLTLAGGTATNTSFCAFAGGYATGDATGTVYTVGNIEVTLAGGSWGTAHGGRGIFGGVFASQVGAGAGDVAISISGGTMGNVYGGGWAQKEGTSTVGDVAIAISGGTVANVFGGGSHSTSGGTTSADNVTITVSGGDISGAIYARGQLDGDTVANSTVIFTGAKDFSCGVYGYSYVGATEESNATLTFAGYTGEFAGEIGGFDSIEFNDGTAMTLATLAADVTNTSWKFDVAARDAALAGTAMLTWSAADFSGDTIALNLKTGQSAEWTLVDAATDTNYHQFDVLVDGESIIADTIGLDKKIVGGAYDGWGFTLEDSALKFKNLA